MAPAGFIVMPFRRHGQLAPQGLRRQSQPSVAAKCRLGEIWSVWSAATANAAAIRLAWIGDPSPFLVARRQIYT